MALYFQRKNDTRVIRAFRKKLADIPNGCTVSQADFTQAVVKEGTPIGKGSDGLYHIIKCATATATATNTATTYVVAKGHNFKVGDFICLGVGKKAYAITAIADHKADTTMDDITVDTTLGVAVAVGDVFVQASASGTSASLVYTPKALVGEDYPVESIGSLMVNAVVIGTIAESNIDGINADVKSALNGIVFL